MRMVKYVIYTLVEYFLLLLHSNLTKNLTSLADIKRGLLITGKQLTILAPSCMSKGVSSYVTLVCGFQTLSSRVAGGKGV